MADKLDQTIETLMNSIEQHISTKTVMGEPVTANGVTVFPLANVSFGAAAGAFNKEKGDSGAGGIGAKVTPTALLIIQNGSSKIVRLNDENTVDRVINMVPDVVNKIAGIFVKDPGKPAE